MTVFEALIIEIAAWVIAVIFFLHAKNMNLTFQDALDYRVILGLIGFTVLNIKLLGFILKAFKVNFGTKNK